MGMCPTYLTMTLLENARHGIEPMTTTPVDFNPRFGAFILETLTLGMYGEARNALREYIQNSFDAIQQASAEGLPIASGRVEITLAEDLNSLVIRDNGIGLRSENAAAVLASVGASNKSRRHSAGFRGIGRLAGIVFCDELIFETKAAGDATKTVVRFDAKSLRHKMSPESGAYDDASTVLRDCVLATRVNVETQLEDSFFEVQLNGFTNPPVECGDIKSLRSFLSQVSPLQYDPDFPMAAAISARAAAAGFPIDYVRVFTRLGNSEFVELFKPYGKTFWVKNSQIELTGIDEVRSETDKWWGWVGRKRVAGAFKDVDAQGIRVRVRNIQIDGKELLRDIFSISYLSDSPRSSYARFNDWYVGEIFVSPRAAIPNARRDGFEEDVQWEAIRNELDTVVATRYGKLAYKTSQGDQITPERLAGRVSALRETTERFSAQLPTFASASDAAAELTDVQRRLDSAMRNADILETAQLTKVSEDLRSVRVNLEPIVARAVAQGHDCEQEIADAQRDLIIRLQVEFGRRLDPIAFAAVRRILDEWAS